MGDSAALCQELDALKLRNAELTAKVSQLKEELLCKAELIAQISQLKEEPLRKAELTAQISQLKEELLRFREDVEYIREACKALDGKISDVEEYLQGDSDDFLYGGATPWSGRPVTRSEVYNVIDHSNLEPWIKERAKEYSGWLEGKHPVLENGDPILFYMP